MTYNDLQTSTDARVTTYEYAEVIITSSAGSDRTYVVDFGDEFPFTITDLTEIVSDVRSLAGVLWYISSTLLLGRMSIFASVVKSKIVVVVLVTVGKVVVVSTVSQYYR
jgi:hypothetical protein